MRARFGMGLCAGLLLGFLIIGASVLYSSNQTGSLGAAELPYQLALATSSTVSTTTTVTNTTSTSVGAFRAIASSNLSTVTSPPEFPSALEASIASSSASHGRSLLASQVDNIARQPLVMSLAVFLPILAAVFFGLLLYHVSRARQEEETAVAR